jgi:hypothetical protein
VAVSCSECTVKEGGLTSQAQNIVRTVIACSKTRYHLRVIPSDSKLLSGFSWTINGNPDNNLDSRCITVFCNKLQCFYPCLILCLRHVTVIKCSVS